MKERNPLRSGSVMTRIRSKRIEFLRVNEIPVTFFLIRVWRAVLSSLRVVALASTTKDNDEEGLRFGVGIVNKEEEEEEEGNAQEWRKESEEASIVVITFSTFNLHNTLLTLTHACHRFHSLSAPYPSNSTTLHDFNSIFQAYVLLIFYCRLNCIF